TPGFPIYSAYSPDGRFVFASGGRPDYLRWWDVETGQLVGETDECSQAIFVDGGNKLIIQNQQDLSLHFWEVATGQELGEWAPKSPPGRRIKRFSSERGNRYLLADLEPDSSAAARVNSPMAKQLTKWLSDRLSKNSEFKDQSRVLILDAVNRREVGDVP